MYVDYSLPRGLLSIDLTTLWHNRLGHPGPTPAKILGLPSGIIDFMTCNLKKAQCLPFGNHFKNADLPLDCVHIDLFVQFLKKKSDAFSQFLLVKKGMENHHDRTLKKLVSDCGGEFLNENFNDLSRDCGFKHVFAPPETPQQNVFSERENRTILETAHCMLGASNLPRSYWEEELKTATMLSNILPTPLRINKSPYTLWTGQSPKIQRLRTFGYSKILTTKHVTFCENIFPCLKDKETTNNCSIVLEEPDSEIMAETHLSKESMAVTDVSQLLEEDLGAPSDQEDAPCEEGGPIPGFESGSPPDIQSKIRVIGMHNCVLVTSKIDNLNILPYSRRANSLVTGSGVLLFTFNASLSSMDKDKWINAIKK
ncbi:hypothetical protein O181_056387 [Austropuccinia psidii MF-1]|uniref:Integrase catalytic domain-containing protein n=1 Tax=Austropuccinia psidii MF-1 TaxID=1389203 RepID=A0A9Q3HUD7_9BASI|nr:hypothetical protein [Austropuccinia psidii MF-1]